MSPAVGDAGLFGGDDGLGGYMPLPHRDHKHLGLDEPRQNQQLYCLVGDGNTYRSCDLRQSVDV